MLALSFPSISLKPLQGNVVKLNHSLHEIIFLLLFLSINDLEIICPTASKPQLLNTHRNSLEVHIDEIQRRSLILKKNILVVDDDEINLLVETSYIKKLGFTILSVARNGEEAIIHIKEAASKGEFFDIIFMDCNMPVMDGFDATKILTTMIENETIPNLAVIACTANASSKDCEKCFKSGMIDYIVKPFSKNELNALIKKHSKKITSLKM